jgi:hypothetical protein|tara:strand:- start:63 stop:260 length:198 start_codon:yes stop_codon:yes gene_type:complete
MSMMNVVSKFWTLKITKTIGVERIEITTEEVNSEQTLDLFEKKQIFSAIGFSLAGADLATQPPTK